MTYGISITNNDNAILIDDRYRSFGVSKLFTASSGSNTFATLPSADCFFDGSFYVLKVASDPPGSIAMSRTNNTTWVGHILKNNAESTGRLYLPSTALFEVGIVREIHKSPPTGGAQYGLEVYGSEGVLGFSTNSPLFRVTHIFSIPLNSSSVAGTWNFSFPTISFPRALYVSMDSIVTVRVGTTVRTNFFYFNGMTMNANSASVSLGLTYSTDAVRERRNEAVYTLRVGYIV
jgi:hypothetical protein